MVNSPPNVNEFKRNQEPTQPVHVLPCGDPVEYERSDSAVHRRFSSELEASWQLSPEGKSLFAVMEKVYATWQWVGIKFDS